MLQIVTILFTGATLGVGCGGDDDSGGGDVSTGLAASKLLSDVTPQEAEQACQNLQSGFQRRFDESKIIRAVCTMFAASSTETPDACEDARDSCIDQANQQSEQQGGLTEAPELDCEGDTDIASCEGTVADFENCFNDTLDGINAALNSITCADAGTVDDTEFDVLGDFEPPASCESLQCEAVSFGSTEE